MNEVVIYKTKDSHSQVEVHFEKDTVWLNRQQLAILFDRDIKTIGKHINNVFEERELEKRSVVANFATTAADGKKYQVDHYSLDVIISVGYRVKSVRGTQFRQWATRRLREYLIEGYTINKKRLAERDLEVRHLKTGITILRRAIAERAASLDDAGSLAALLERFSGGLELLDDYDHATLDNAGKTRRKAALVKADAYRRLIGSMRGNFASDLFGKEKDSGFESSIMQIYQSFSGKEAYSTLEEKAAMLLYLIVKNHSFVDGNKRIAAACFLYFLDKNRLLYDKAGNPRIENDTLAALTLFTAVSKPAEMQTVKQVIMSVLNRKKEK